MLAAETQKAQATTSVLDDYVFNASGPATVPVTIRGATGQYADLTQWQSADGTNLTRVLNDGSVITPHAKLVDTRSTAAAPELHFVGSNGKWAVGIDVAATVPARDFFIAKINETKPGVTDVFYLHHNGDAATVCGIGWVSKTPPNYRLHVSPEDSQPDMGGLAIRVPSGSSGNPLAFINSATGEPKSWIDTSGNLSNFGIRAVPGTAPNMALRFSRSDGSNVFGIRYADNGSLEFAYLTGGVASFRIRGSGRFEARQTADFAAFGAQLPHVGARTPSGGYSGEVRVGNDKLWVNDQGVWKSAAVS